MATPKSLRTKIETFLAEKSVSQGVMHPWEKRTWRHWPKS